MTKLNIAILALHAVIVYAWALFPVILLCLPRRRTRAMRKPPVKPPPSVAFILSAFNEENHIGDRLRNLLATNYPADRWRAFVGVDGANDRTAVEAQAAAAGHANIQVLVFAENRGKVAVLKDLVMRARREADPAEIFVFTDANTDFEPDALSRLVEPFANPEVGGVCGRLVFVEPKSGVTDENVYWKLENWLKSKESDLDSCLGANGAIYAIRAALFWMEIPSNTIIDDFVIGMKVREQGYRFVYEPQAVAAEELPSRVHHEWKRRVRIGAGDYQAIRLCARSLRPAFGVFAWAFWSHKILRWFTPHFMIAGAVLAAAGAASEAPIVGSLVLCIYSAGAVAFVLGSALVNSSNAAARLLRGIQYLLAMQAALFAGFLRFCRGNLEGRWQRSER